MMVVANGDTVKVEYEGKFEDGEVFDASKNHPGGKPLEFEVGAGMVIPGFDTAVVGMNEGDEKEVTIEPKDGYGEYNDSLKQQLPRSMLPPEQEPKEGMMLMVGTPDGRQMPVKIIAVDKETITVDLNHPLAGKKLIFTIKVVGITKGAGKKTA